MIKRIVLFISLAAQILGVDLPICTPSTENEDGTKPSCLNTFGCLWDLSQCTKCQNVQCKCQTYNTCDSCIDGKFYNPVSSLCEDCPANCKSCCLRNSLTEYTCSECNAGYTLIGGTCQDITGCNILLDNSNQCIQCLDGYYLDENLKCNKCDVKCSKCLTKYDCIECNTTTYKLIDNLCEVCCPGKPQGICTNCDYTVPTVPVICSPLANCQNTVYNFAEERCACYQCDVGYYLVREVTPTLKDTCMQCLQSQRCIQDLADPTSPYSSLVVECDSQSIYDLKTKVCVSNKFTMNGIDSYYNCRRMYDNSCSDCFDGFYPEIVDTVTRQYLCYQNQQADKCKTPTNKGISCSVCNPMYYLDSNQNCIACNGACTLDSCKICLECNSNACTKCKGGYRLKDGQCSKCSNQNCQTCDQLEKICTKCQKGYGLNSQAKDDADQCIQCQDHCEECDVDFRKCTKCEDDYFNQDYVCKSKPINCILHQNGFCIQCVYSYIAEGGYCIQCANDNIGIYTCPSTCSDNEITLVELLHSNILKPSILIFLIVAFLALSAA